MNGYVAFYRGRQFDVYAESSYAAQTKAAAVFKARKQHDVTVVLATTPEGPIIHVPVE